MSDLPSALYTRLTTNAQLIPLVGTRVYWVMVPPGATRPYIRLQVVSDDRSSNLGGYDGSRVTRVQADCFGSTYGSTRQLAEMIISVLSVPGVFAGVVFGVTKAEGPRDLGEDTSAGFIHRASVDLLVEHALA